MTGEFDLNRFEGQQLAQRFQLGRLLGQGGYGAVFEATQLSVSRRCAIKVLHANIAHGDDNVIDRFKSEAIATSRLTHPNSVVIYDFGHDDALGVLFLAMEFLNGRDLNDMIQQQGPLDLHLTLHIVDQIAASLQDAHDHGIVHRDIKPHNIMIIKRGLDEHAVKVIDFGIARVMQESTSSTLDRLTNTGVMIGTPHYMAPEQIRDHDVDGRTDIYSLACCVYKMLTGRTPFMGGTPVDIACQQLTDRPLPLSAYAPDELKVPRALDDVLLQAMDKAIDRRFDTISAFAQALRQAATGERAVSRLPMHTSPPRALHTPLPDTRPLNPPTTPLSGELLEQHRREDMGFGETLQADSGELPQGGVEREEAAKRATMMLFPVVVGAEGEAAGAATAQLQQPAASPDAASLSAPRPMIVDDAPGHTLVGASILEVPALSDARSAQTAAPLAAALPPREEPQHTGALIAPEAGPRRWIWGALLAAGLCASVLLAVAVSKSGAPANDEAPMTTGALAVAPQTAPAPAPASPAAALPAPPAQVVSPAVAPAPEVTPADDPAPAPEVKPEPEAVAAVEAKPKDKPRQRDKRDKPAAEVAVKVEPKPEPVVEAPARPAARASVPVRFQIIPYGTILVAGKEHRVPATITLPEGDHTVRYWRQDGERPSTKKITVSAGMSMVILE